VIGKFIWVIFIGMHQIKLKDLILENKQSNWKSTFKKNKSKINKVFQGLIATQKGKKAIDEGIIDSARAIIGKAKGIKSAYDHLMIKIASHPVASKLAVIAVLTVLIQSDLSAAQDFISDIVSNPDNVVNDITSAVGDVATTGQDISSGDGLLNLSSDDISKISDQDIGEVGEKVNGMAAKLKTELGELKELNTKQDAEFFKNHPDLKEKGDMVIKKAAASNFNLSSDDKSFIQQIKQAKAAEIDGYESFRERLKNVQDLYGKAQDRAREIAREIEFRQDSKDMGVAR
jgi:hypothetical protein